MIWKQSFSLEQLNELSADTMVSALGIRFVEQAADMLCAAMPITSASVQPMRLLHGGASAALAETVGSVASLLCLEDIDKQYAVGSELNISHLRAATEGNTVIAVCRPYRLGRSLHVWNIEISDAQDRTRLLAVARLTMAVVTKV